MLGKKCKWDVDFTCFKLSGCEYKTLIECLKNSIVFMARELEKIKHRQMQRHTASSIRWRNQAFYYKKKVRSLELYIMQSCGRTVPSSEELKELKEAEPNEKG